MGFVARLKINDAFVPSRAYVHEVGFKNWLDGRSFGDVKNSLKNYYKELIWSQGVLRGYDFSIGVLWFDGADKPDVMSDIFGFRGLKRNWGGNPEIKNWVYRGGFCYPNSPTTCGDGVIVIGREEEFRRLSSGLKTFMNNAPDLTKVGFKLDFDDFS